MSQSVRAPSSSSVSEEFSADPGLLTFDDADEDTFDYEDTDDDEDTLDSEDIFDDAEARRRSRVARLARPP